MRLKLFLLLFLCLGANAVSAQNGAKLDLKNVLIVGQFDQEEDRYSIEVALTELFSEKQVAVLPSLNLLKSGENLNALLNDSLTSIAKSKGFNTYVVVFIRGYDRRFKVSENLNTLKSVLEQGNLFTLFKEDMVSISFEFRFYQNGNCIYTEMVRVANVSSRDTVLKKFKKKVSKVIQKNWIQ